MQIVKKILMVKVPQITKETPYARALKVAALILLFPEVLILGALPFKVFSPIEVGQITLFLVGLAFVMPFVLRLGEKKLMTWWLLFTVSSVLVVVLLYAGDSYYVKRVLSAYLDGADYHTEEDRLQWLASSSARSYTWFFMGENDFLKKCADDIRLGSEMPSVKQTEYFASLNKSVLMRARGLDDRFRETGYSNSTTVAALKIIHRNYEKILSYLDGKLNNDDLEGSRQ